MRTGLLVPNTNTKSLNLACPLRAYSIQQTLNDMGVDNEIIDYCPVGYPKDFDGKYPLFSQVDHPDKDSKVQREQLKKWKNLFYPRAARYDKVKAFEEQYIKKSACRYDADDLENMNPGYDAYISAAGVLWKYGEPNGFDKGYFLASRRLGHKPKAAYAVSRGAEKYTAEQEKMFRKYIRPLVHIAVRERNFQSYIQNSCHREVSYVDDVLFLHDRVFYEKLAAYPEKKGYVLIYLSTDNNTALVETAVAFAAEQGLEILELSEQLNNEKLPQGSSHPVIYDIGVEEWIGYIAGASYIFTNSLAACSLSIILGKQFWVGNRSGHGIDSLLGTFGLEDRRMGTEHVPVDVLMQRIDYDKIERKRSDVQQHSKMELQKTVNCLQTYCSSIWYRIMNIILH